MRRFDGMDGKGMAIPWKAFVFVIPDRQTDGIQRVDKCNYVVIIWQLPFTCSIGPRAHIPKNLSLQNRVLLSKLRSVLLRFAREEEGAMQCDRTAMAVIELYHVDRFDIIDVSCF